MKEKAEEQGVPANIRTDVVKKGDYLENRILA